MTKFSILPDVDLTILPSKHGNVVLSHVSTVGRGFRDYSEEAGTMGLADFVKWLDKHHFSLLRPYGLHLDTRWYLQWP